MSASHPGDRDTSKCYKCEAKLPLVAQAQPCRCKRVFCDKHRDPEKHDCDYNYAEQGRSQIRRENPAVYKSSSNVSTEGAWLAEYWKHHNPRSVYSIFHSIGFVVLMYFVLIRGLIFNFFSFGLSGILPAGNIFSGGNGGEHTPDAGGMGGVGLPLPGEDNESRRREAAASGEDTFGSVFVQNLIYGLVLGFLLTHTAPHLYFKYYLGGQPQGRHAEPVRPLFGCPNACRFCFFSWDTANIFSNPKCVYFALLSEWEMLKDHVLFYIITNGGTNCLGHLYHGKNRDVGYIYGTVSKRLGELQKQQ